MKIPVVAGEEAAQSDFYHRAYIIPITERLIVFNYYLNYHEKQPYYSFCIQMKILIIWENTHVYDKASYAN